jgi:hypothetical protein
VRNRIDSVLRLSRQSDLVLHHTSRKLRYLEDDARTAEVVDRRTFLRDAFQYVAFNGIPGDYAEFGCYGAVTFRLAWAASQLHGISPHFWGYDSFEGLPASDDPRDEHPMWREGELLMSESDFHRACEEFGMPANAFTTVVGWYSDTLTPLGPSANPTTVAFGYIDCDMYSSTIDVLRFLEPRIDTGSLLAFDDWFCYGPGRVSGERAAALDVFGDGATFRLEPYKQFAWAGMSFVVERVG